MSKGFVMLATEPVSDGVAGVGDIGGELGGIVEGQSEGGVDERDVAGVGEGGIDEDGGVGSGDIASVIDGTVEGEDAV